MERSVCLQAWWLMITGPQLVTTDCVLKICSQVYCTNIIDVSKNGQLHVLWWSGVHISIYISLLPEEVPLILRNEGGKIVWLQWSTVWFCPDSDFISLILSVDWYTKELGDCIWQIFHWNKTNTVLCALTWLIPHCN